MAEDGFVAQTLFASEELSVVRERRSYMNLTRTRRREDWSPLTRLRDRLDQLFDYPSWEETPFFEGWAPTVDIREDKDKLFVEAELPGMKKEDISLSMHENTLVISGERKCEQENKEGDIYRCERYYGKFHRSIGLPFAVDASKIQAQYRDGVLKVTLPKSEAAKPKQIEVKVG
jgi:HSP20 family protein